MSRCWLGVALMIFAQPGWADYFPTEREYKEAKFEANRIDPWEAMGEFSDSNRYRTYGAKVGRLKVNFNSDEGMSWCTATLISSDLIITAQHCFDPKFKDKPKPPNFKPLNAWLELSYDSMEDAKYTQRYEVSVALVEADPVLDYAIARLINISFSPDEVAKFSVVSYKNREELFIVHHPGGEPKRVTRLACRQRMTQQFQLFNRCETNLGSSGAPLFSDNTPSDGIYAIHTGAKWIGGEYWNVATLVSNIAAKSCVVSSLLKKQSLSNCAQSPAATISAALSPPVASRDTTNDP